ncbi:hypothetical protein L6452_18200 [Arctium lappa]|uniref:Uncharacterized protein n=1 Tax=Arctium lappa TaxID=4217 RepID=A0ACB9C5G7_ARCLA|nr:hypothetical protein L6452_18200 [Arctium lappa]
MPKKGSTRIFLCRIMEASAEGKSAKDVAILRQRKDKYNTRQKKRIELFIGKARSGISSFELIGDNPVEIHCAHWDDLKNPTQKDSIGKRNPSCSEEADLAEAIVEEDSMDRLMNNCGRRLRHQCPSVGTEFRLEISNVLFRFRFESIFALLQA